MSLFSRRPRNIADFEKEIAKLQQKKKLSGRNAEKLQDYESKLSILKEQKAAEEKKKAKQKRMAVYTIIGAIVLFASVITIGTVSERKRELPVDTPAYTQSDTSNNAQSPTEDTPSGNSETPESSTSSKSESSAPANSTPATEVTLFSLGNIPAYSGSPYVAVNNNTPYFSESDYTTTSYEYYSDLDSLGRCGVCVASIGKDLMPTEERGSIGSVKPTGWHTVKYDNVDGKYLYNRCHLIGYQLSGENANVRNLITGTRYLNIQGMLPFENMVADYVKETGNHVLYRATPIFDGDNLLATGVLLEGYSVEDGGDGICFNVFCYNVQPDIDINYTNGESSGTAPQTSTPPRQDESEPQQSTNTVETTYILNTNTHKFHYPSCSSVSRMSESNKQTYSGSRDDLISQGYEPCKRCNP